MAITEWMSKIARDIVARDRERELFKEIDFGARRDRYKSYLGAVNEDLHRHYTDAEFADAEARFHAYVEDEREHKFWWG